ncbi:two-component system sensor histidine kinase BaeS [Herbaspirillum sp. SJZ107]|nr:two-component system sensor histidine kinase BaeS [Herbaspirillum sp. SJZ107]
MAFHFPFRPTLRFSIGHRLFVSVLLAILAVAAGAVFLLRQNVLASFGDYAVGIELDRLDELSAALARQYRSHGGWTFIPADGRQAWIARELARLQRVREGGLPAAPPGPAAPSLPAAAAGPAAALPADPPAPPAPPAPPPPPPLSAPRVLAADVDPVAGPLSLPRRITLFDAGGSYLAGRPPGAIPLARRAIESGGRTVGWIGVARGARPSDAMAYAFLEQLHSSLWLIFAAAVGLSALAAIGLARHFRRPIGALEDGARKLADGRFETRLPVTRSDELGDLARHFNALASRLQGAEDARRQWVADTSHELRTPLAVLRAQLEALQDGVRSATPDTLDAMLRQVLALNKLIDELYALARADVGALDCRPLPLDLWQLACGQLDAFAERLGAAGLALDIGPAPAHGTVLADPDRMRQVLDNLLENSLRYTAPGGRVALHAQAGHGRLQLHLDDSAPGVPDAALARLGERFYRIDASRSRAHGGAGLGLALCRRLLEAQGAALAFGQSPLGGLRVTISIPTLKETA